MLADAGTVTAVVGESCSREITPAHFSMPTLKDTLLFATVILYRTILKEEKTHDINPRTNENQETARCYGTRHPKCYSMLQK